MPWQPREPPLIVVDDSFVLDRWRPADGPALRRFDLDSDTARFFGYSVAQAAPMPDSHYDGDMRKNHPRPLEHDGREACSTAGTTAGVSRPAYPASRMRRLDWGVTRLERVP